MGKGSIILKDDKLGGNLENWDSMGTGAKSRAAAIWVRAIYWGNFTNGMPRIMIR